MTLEQNLLHRDNSEKSVLGAISVDNSILDEVSPIVKPHMFGNNQNKWVYEAMLSLRENGTEINDLTIFQEIVKQGNSDKMSAYDVTSCLPYTSPSQATYFATTIADTHMKLETIKVAERLIAKAKMDTSNGMELLEVGMKTLEEINDSTGVASGISTYAEILEKMQQEIDSHVEGQLSGVPSGLDSIDSLTGGWQDGHLIIIAARPAMGKSALLTTMVRNAAMQGFPCAIFSIEMSDTEVGSRLISPDAQLSSKDINKKRLFKDQKDHFRNVAKSVKDLPIYVGDAIGLTLQSFKSQARNLVRKHGVKLIGVDYIQIMLGDKANGREQEVSGITRELKNLARELGIPIIALSQLSRAVEQRPIPRPQLSDLRESGGIEQDANIVAFLYRPEYYAQQRGEEVHPDDMGIAQMIFSKGRDGELGDLDLGFIGEYGYFHDLETDVRL